MLTGLLIGALALIAFLYVVLPLLAPGQTDPLPDDRDPVLVDLKEERDALFRAVRELDAREDLRPERREQLRERYEGKAAQVLSKIDEREGELAGRPRQRPATDQKWRRAPYGVVAVLASLVVIAALVPSYVLPRIGEDSNVTTTDMEAAQQLQAQQRAAEQDPSMTNLLALGDTYLALQMVDDAEATYMKAVNSDEPAPAGIYQRLAVIYLQRDLTEAQHWLTLARNADPNDVDTLFLLGEVSWVTGSLEEAHSAYTDFLAIAEEPEPQVEERVALLNTVLPLHALAEASPSVGLLLDLGDAYWQAGEFQRAVGSYFQVLTEFDVTNPVALARTGQVLYMAGRPDDAASTLERAAASAGGLTQLEPASVRALADAYLQLEEWEPAANVYGAYVEMVGPAEAGNAGELMVAAAARAAGETIDGTGEDAIVQLMGEQVFGASCAECHGDRGIGGIGGRLAGNSRSANRANVADAVRFGRGTMPAFQAELSQTQIDAVVAYVAGVLAEAR